MVSCKSDEDTINEILTKWNLDRHAVLSLETIGNVLVVSIQLIA